MKPLFTRKSATRFEATKIEVVTRPLKVAIQNIQNHIKPEMLDFFQCQLHNIFIYHHQFRKNGFKIIFALKINFKCDGLFFTRPEILGHVHTQRQILMTLFQTMSILRQHQPLHTRSDGLRNSIR